MYATQETLRCSLSYFGHTNDYSSEDWSELHLAKRMQLFWDWDPNHAPEGTQGTSVHVQVSFIANRLLS